MGEVRETLQWSLLPLRALLGVGNDGAEAVELGVPSAPAFSILPSAPAFPSLLKPGCPCAWSFRTAAGPGFGKPWLSWSGFTSLPSFHALAVPSLCFLPSSLCPRELPQQFGVPLLSRQDSPRGVSQGREAEAPPGSISKASPEVLLSGFTLFPPNIAVLRFVGAVTIAAMDVVVVVSEPFLSDCFSKGNKASAIPGCQSVGLVFCRLSLGDFHQDCALTDPSHLPYGIPNEHLCKTIIYNVWYPHSSLCSCWLSPLFVTSPGLLRYNMLHHTAWILEKLLVWLFSCLFSLLLLGLVFRQLAEWLSCLLQIHIVLLRNWIDIYNWVINLEYWFLIESAAKNAD